MRVFILYGGYIVNFYPDLLLHGDVKKLAVCCESFFLKLGLLNLRCEWVRKAQDCSVGSYCLIFGFGCKTKEVRMQSTADCMRVESD